VSEEFLNVGIVTFFPETFNISFKYTNRFKRITRSFSDVDTDYLKKLLQNIYYRLTEKSIEIKNHNLFNDKFDFKIFFSEVLPIENLSLRFSDIFYGNSDDANKTVNYLFERYINKYNDKSSRYSRSDEDVWKVFKEPMLKRKLTDKLTSHKIVTNNYEHEFEHCWKNDIWHINEPISFDLKEGSTILEKANTWLGRATILNEKKDFKLYLLLGKPQNQSLNNYFVKAENILNEMPCKKEFIREDEAEEFAEELLLKMGEHS